jgi:hypothetical protein
MTPTAAKEASMQTYFWTPDVHSQLIESLSRRVGGHHHPAQHRAIFYVRVICSSCKCSYGTGGT